MLEKKIKFVNYINLQMLNFGRDVKRVMLQSIWMLQWSQSEGKKKRN